MNHDTMYQACATHYLLEFFCTISQFYLQSEKILIHCKFKHNVYLNNVSSALLDTISSNIAIEHDLPSPLVLDSSTHLFCTAFG